MRLMTNEENPIGAHVVYERPNKLYLGEVYGCFLRRGKRHLIVKHFNGEDWNFDPLVGQVLVLEREYDVDPEAVEERQRSREESPE